jgi:hypothetical protein
MNGFLSFVDAAHQAHMDQRDLNYVQNDPQYKDKTALVLLLLIMGDTSRMDKSWK